MNKDNLQNLANRYEELETHIADPQLIQNRELYLEKLKEHARLAPIYQAFQEYLELEKNYAEHLQLGAEEEDPEMKNWIREEQNILKQKLEKQEENLRILLLPQDPRDQLPLYLEIRGGAGGEEAALFASDLLRMYQAYVEKKGWRSELVDWNETELGGMKEAVLRIEGEGAFRFLQFEKGVHRVQRVPSTESGGRIHTSTVTVAVLTEVPAAQVEINPNDLQIDTYRASGAGGQHVNKTDSAIRITHLPTGIVVTCQDQRSQYKNKDRAMAILRAKLLEQEEEKRAGSLAQDRKNQVGSGDRSERIRTYNFPQGRVTDHRLGLTLYQIEAVLNGDLDPFVQALVEADQAAKLALGEGEG